VNIEAGDEVEFEDGRCGSVVEVHSERIVVNVGGKNETIDAQFEGEIGEE